MKSIKKFKILLFIIGLLGTLFLSNSQCAYAEALDSDKVVFKDLNLENVIRNKLNKPTGDITVGEMKNMTGRIYAEYQEIKDLTGLEHAEKITYLDLSCNEITDISALTELSSLQNLYLTDNKITDIPDLSSLISLTALRLSDNPITDISNLNRLTNLKYLNLDNTKITNIPNLTNLKELSLNDTKIENITNLSSFTNLTTLQLNNANITDISFLDKLTMLDTLLLNNNQITSIPNLNMLYNLRRLELNNNKIVDISNLNRLTSLYALYLDANEIVDIPDLSSLSSLDTLCLSNNKIVEIPDLSSLRSLDTLYLSNNKIVDISNLNRLTSLYALYLDANEIVDISALSYLSNLEQLNLSENKIVNISSLNSLTILRYLYLNDNEIVEISDLSYLSNLEELELNNNKIVDISNLNRLTSLYFLTLNNNQIKDIGGLSDLTNLWFLDLSNNKIKSIPEFISEFSELEFLNLKNNHLKGDIPTFLNGLNLSPKLAESEDIIFTSFSGNYLTGNVSDELLEKLGEDAFSGNLLENVPNQKQLTVIPDSKLGLLLSSKVTQKELRNVVQLFEGEDLESKSVYELELVPVEEGFFDENGKAIKLGETTAYIKIKGLSESNTYGKTLTTIPITIGRITSNNNLKLDFILLNSLEITLGSNVIDFGNISAEGGEIESTTLLVSSSLPYNINTKAYNDFVGDSDSSNIIPIEKLSLDIDNKGFIQLSKEKILNLGDNPNSIDKLHNLNFKIGNTIGYKKDNYSTNIQFIVDSK